MIREWSKRSAEIKYLLNPAFCGRIIYASVIGYEKRCGQPIPFLLIYLILPLILHKITRERIILGSRTNLLRWTQTNNDILIDFASRARSLLEITNEALEFLLCAGLIEITDDGCITKIRHRKLSDTDFTDEEIQECLLKVKYVARWFADSPSIENIYTCLGIKP